MDDITKQMCKQLVENYYGSNKKLLKEEPEVDAQSDDNSEEVPNGDLVKFSPSDDITKAFIKGLTDYLNSGGGGTKQSSFNDLVFDKRLNRVTWSGKIENKIEWEVIYMNDASNQEKGVYFNVNFEDLSTEQTIALNRLNVYLRNTWFKDIETAIQNKTLEKK
jgi:hypothetical protein